MKKISFVLMAFLVSLVSMAQHTQFGIKGGLNLASLGDERFQVTGSRTAYHVGGLAHIHISPVFALQPEIVYSAQGAEYGEGTAKLNYINVPVVGQYMFKNGFRLEAGPQVGLLTKAVSDVNGNETDIKSSINNFDFSVAFGAGYLTRSGLGFGARYNLGISDINEVEQYDDNNRVWQFGIFYQFRK